MTIRIDRVYTRKGDDGETHLAGGSRVSKDSLRVAAYGSVDELNASIGVAREELRSGPSAALAPEMEPLLSRIQQKLFDLGAFLATEPARYREGMPGVAEKDVRALEEDMDRWGKDLEPLSSFILPGGGKLAALLHVARTVCRRAEREAVALHRAERLGGLAIPDLNRLSDWLFVAARRASRVLGEAEALWKPERPSGGPGQADPPRA